MTKDTTEQAPHAPRRGFLGQVERIGNALPDPMTLFAVGAVMVFVLSSLVAGTGHESVLTDADGRVVRTESAIALANAGGLRWLFENLVSIFINFRPLGLVLVASIGIAVAERSGLVSAGLRAILVYVPDVLLTPATFFSGIMSSMAVDAGYVVLPPLAASVYKAAGRNPLHGIAAVIAGVGAGFNANLFITSLDPMLSGLTETAARLIEPEYTVSAACNWYFLIASTFLLTLVGWFVSYVFVERRARRAVAIGVEHGDADLALAPEERRGLLWAGIAMVGTLAFLAANVGFSWGFLHDPPGTVGPGLERTFATWISSIVPLLLILFLVPGIAYGVVAKTIRSDRDVVRMMSEYLALLSNYVVLAFFAAIFVKAFERSNLGTMLAIEGGNFLSRFDLPAWGLMVAFLLLTAFINMFMGSMSAKWAMLATVFVPMFMVLGISPELTQVTYRIGDSITNPISPLNMYIVVVLVFMRQHDPKAGLGTLISLLLPYSIAFGIAWTVLLVVWMRLGVPLGENAPLFYEGAF